MRDHDQLKNSLLDLGQLVKEHALEAVAERAKHRGQAAPEFYEGYVLGLHRIVSLMPQQALAFGIDLTTLRLDGIKPDCDLV